MTVKIFKILSSEEFQDINNKAMDSGLYNADPSIFTPGMGYEMNWYYDPSGRRESNKKPVMFTKKDRDDILSRKVESHFLSMNYWRDWSHIRPPVTIVCPNKAKFLIDGLSKSGEDGWKVTGFFPMITISPSVDLPGYHGTILRGLFSVDLNGRGPHGVPSC